MTASMKPYSSASCAGEPAIAIRIGLDLFERLAGVERDALGELLLHEADLLGLDRDVRGLALHPPIKGWCIRIRLLGNEKRLPGAPATAGTSMEAAMPMQIVRTSAFTYCMVS